jgi:hypothetical protein
MSINEAPSASDEYEELVEGSRLSIEATNAKIEELLKLDFDKGKYFHEDKVEFLWVPEHLAEGKMARGHGVEINGIKIFKPDLGNIHINGNGLWMSGQIDDLFVRRNPTIFQAMRRQIELLAALEDKLRTWVYAQPVQWEHYGRRSNASEGS